MWPSTSPNFVASRHVEISTFFDKSTVDMSTVDKSTANFYTSSTPALVFVSLLCKVFGLCLNLEDRSLLVQILFTSGSSSLRTSWGNSKMAFLTSLCTQVFFWKLFLCQCKTQHCSRGQCVCLNAGKIWLVCILRKLILWEMTLTFPVCT